MSVRDPRTRLISFRLSEGEYQALQRLCDAKEARSLSDFVRGTVQSLAHGGDPSHAELPEPSYNGDKQEAAGDAVTLSTEFSSNGWELIFARELLALGRRMDALDREVRRLRLLVNKA